MAIKSVEKNRVHRKVVIFWGLLMGLGAQAKILIEINGTDVFEVPRSKTKTYAQKQGFDQSLKPIQAVKPGSLTDEELLSVPERYLPPELQEKQKRLRAQGKNAKKALARVVKKSKDTVTIRQAGKTIELKIDDTVLAAMSDNREAPLLAPSRKLPDVELLGEVSTKAGEKIKSEFTPGDTREIHRLFDQGNTNDENRMPLLPAYKQYAQEDYASAITLALEFFSSQRVGTETRELARYMTAHALYQRGFYGTSLPLLLDLVTSKWRRSAIGMAARSIEKTRDDSAALLIISKVSIAQIPEEFRPVFSYHLGRSLMNSGAGAPSIAAFEKVPVGHVRYPESQYYVGVIKSAETGSSVSGDDWDKEGSALYEARAHFETALSASGQRGAFDLRDLIQLSLARLAYQAKQYNRSIYHYNEVRRDSPFLKESLFESAWALYRTGEFNRSLGILHSLGSAYLEGRDFPELWVLRSLNYLKLCRFDESAQAANTFEKSVPVIEAEFTKATKQIRGNTKLNLKTLKDEGINPWIQEWLLADPVVKKDNDSISFLRKEKQMLELLKTNPRIKNAELREAAAEALMKILENRERAISNATRPYLVQRLDDVLADYRAQRGRLELLRFEIYSQATRYPEAVNRPQAKRMIEQAEFLPGVFLKGKETLWKFNGEYWWDELSGYDYFIPTECTNDKRSASL